MTKPFRSFIETQFPVSKLSKESYKERKANYSQTLTGLGKWWGRKPLILVRAVILGLLLPATDDLSRDRDIFLKLLTMDDHGLERRKKKLIPLREVYRLLQPEECDRWFQPDAPEDSPKLKKGTTVDERRALQVLVFNRLSYDEKLQYCDRPEQIDGLLEQDWAEINAHLGTSAACLQDLVRELGERQFGNAPRVGDAFCGGGSIPFEAARIGCEAYGSDLSPVAALLSWAALNIIGGGKEVVEQVQEAQRQVYEAVDHQISEWKIEHNEQGWRADAYLYCCESVCPECGWKVPLAPSWVIGERTRCIARLEPDEEYHRFHIRIQSGVTDAEMEQAKSSGTVRDNNLVCPNPHCERSTPISMLRNNRHSDGDNGLRLWENEDLVPRPEDVFQERLYCIRWVETYYDGDHAITERHYLEPNEQDRQREERVLELLCGRFRDWQERGYIPSKKIESGYNTDQPIRERGWTHWHHLFNPRQLLILGCFYEELSSKAFVDNRCNVASLLAINRCCDYNAKLSRWHPHGANEKSEQVFSNQALNTLFNYATRTIISLRTAYFIEWSLLEDVHDDEYSEIENKDDQNIFILKHHAFAEPKDARTITLCKDIWITDPPYADAINYHELSEFFLAWNEKHLPKLFPDWYTDSKRALAITGSDEQFRQSMVDSYRNLAEHMTDNGVQIVMFTHQNAAVWADLALILWASGLRVTAAWCIATETDSALKAGNYVQGTVLLILRKQTSNETAFFDELYPQVEREVKTQLESMLQLDDRDDPNFGDTDYQLAAYAAALRVLTRYRSIEGFDIIHEISRPRCQGEKSEVEKVIDEAVRIACDYLVPAGFDNFIWKTLTPEERFYVKGLDIESHGECRTGAYQELAKGFGLREYSLLLASSRANQARLKTASEFANRNLGDKGFGNTLVRHALFAVYESMHRDDINAGRNWFRNELQNRYWEQRKTLVEILRYLARFEINAGMPQWKGDAHAALLLAGALENDHI